MKRMLISALLFTIISVTAAILMNNVPRLNAADPTPLTLRGLSSETSENLDLIVNQIKRDREDAFNSLIPILQMQDSSKNRPRIAAAMRIAGTMRLTEAVSLLIDKIDFLEFGALPTTRPIDVFSDPRDYLAIVILVQIGDTAVQPAMQELATDPSDAKVVYLTVVLKDVLGVDCARAKTEAERSKAVAKGKSVKGFNSAIALLQTR